MQIGICNANDGSIVVGVADVGATRVVDVPAFALFIPDKLPVVLQGQFIEALSFKFRSFRDSIKRFLVEKLCDNSIYFSDSSWSFDNTFCHWDAQQ